VYAGLGVHDTMQYISSDVVTICTGMAASMAVYTIISDHSGMPFERVEKDSDRDYWMTAEEAKQYGMIDDVLIKAKH